MRFITLKVEKVKQTYLNNNLLKKYMYVQRSLLIKIHLYIHGVGLKMMWCKMIIIVARGFLESLTL